MRINRLFSSIVMLAAAKMSAFCAPPRPTTPEEMAKIQEAVPAEAPAKAAKPRRILVFSKCEGFVHDSIPVGNDSLKVLGEKTGAYKADFSEDMAVFTADNLKQYDAVLFNNSTRLSFKDAEQRAALMDFVKGGKGCIGLHAASDNFYTWEEAANMMGGQFDGHPWGAGGTWGVKVDEPTHPLNASFNNAGFLINDEIYKIKGVYSRGRQRVLLSLDMSHEPTAKAGAGKCRADNDHPIAWINPWDQGRVFYCSLGHNRHIYSNPAVLRHYLGGIQYALGDYKVDDKPTDTVTPKPVPAGYKAP